MLHHLSMVKASEQEERMGAEQASSCVVHKVVPRAESGAVIFLSFFMKRIYLLARSLVALQSATDLFLYATLCLSCELMPDFKKIPL